MRFVSMLSLVLASAMAPGALADSPAPVHERAATTITGVVFDSLTMRGLADASVQIADARGGAWAKTVASDSAGAFMIADVPVGTYLLGFFHPKLDSLSLGSQTVRVDVRTDEPMRIRLAIPSSVTIARSLCGPKVVSDSTGLLLGYLRSAETSMPRPSGSVTIRWAEFVIEKNSIQRQAPEVTASTGATGAFAVCGVPLGTPLLIQAASATDSSGSFELTVPSSGLLHRDVYVAPFSRTKVTVSDSAPAVDMLRGAGRLRGQVLALNGRPISGARVIMWGTGLEATSNADGQFSLTGLPNGTHTLEVRAVGFSPAQRAVDIVQGVAGATEVEMANLAIALDTVRVVAQRVFTSQRTTDFERRLKMRTGTGHLIDDAEIEKRRPQVLTDILRTIPGVQILPGKRSGEDIFMRGGQAILGSGLCRPNLYIDGARSANDADFPINSMVPVSEVRAIEVYPHASLVPVELQSLSGCGVVAIWTGARRK